MATFYPAMTANLLKRASLRSSLKTTGSLAPLCCTSGMRTCFLKKRRLLVNKTPNTAPPGPCEPQQTCANIIHRSDEPYGRSRHAQAPPPPPRCWKAVPATGWRGSTRSRHNAAARASHAAGTCSPAPAGCSLELERSPWAGNLSVGHPVTVPRPWRPSLRALSMMTQTNLRPGLVQDRPPPTRPKSSAHHEPRSGAF